jgi:ferrous iron transport protein B
MVHTPEVEIGREYYISKLTGRWGIRRRINSIGINSGEKIIFIRKNRSGQYIFKFSDKKKKQKLPNNYLHFINLIPTDDPNFEIKAIADSKTIYVDIFRNEDTPCLSIFEKENEYNFNDYKFIINYLPATSTIYGEQYERKKLRNKIFSDFPDVFFGILDFNNLENDLFLLTQFIDMDAKIVLVVKNYDESKLENPVDFDLLGKLIGIPVLTIKEVEGVISEEDRKKLFETLIRTHKDIEPDVRHVHVNFGREIEKSISNIKKFLKRRTKNDFIASARYLAIGLLENDPLIYKLFENEKWYNKLKQKRKTETEKLSSLYNDHIFNIIKNARKAFVSGAIKEINAPYQPETLTKKIDKIVTHKFWGFPIFIVFMTLTFYSTFEIGKFPMHWLEIGIEHLTNYLEKTLPPGFWKDLIINGAIDGVGGVLVFLPNIFILFFFIGFLETSGYMSRAAFIMDKYMHKIGLHGKSFIPMIMGFGCTVPAILSTRILENKRDRILTMLVVPFMSCSARLPVYILLISAFFPEQPVLILFGIYGFGIMLAMIVSLFFSKTILKQKENPYIMELMPYKRPSIKLLLYYTWTRGKEYLKKIGGIILIGSLIIWLLGYFPRNVEYSKNYDDLISKAKSTEEINALLLKKEAEHHKLSYIGQIGSIIEPVMRPLGFDWKMSISLVAGIAGKEITVSTMGVLYQAKDEGHSLQNKLKSEVYNSGPKAGQPVFNKLVALAFMFFVLIYFPCMAVISAIWKESKFKWAVFTAVYTTALAWLVAFAIYQIGSITQ